MYAAVDNLTPLFFTFCALPPPLKVSASIRNYDVRHKCERLLVAEYWATTDHNFPTIVVM